MDHAIAYSVLILDDELMLLKALEKALKVRGFITFASSNAAESLHMLEMHRPSVVCMDLQIPRVQARDLIYKMRKLSPQLRMIGVTADPDVCRRTMEELEVRLVPKTGLMVQQLEKIIYEELSLSRPDLEGLKRVKKAKSPLRILFVDDEAECAAFSVEIAQTEGITAAAARSPEEVFSKMDSFKPNVLCTDLKMRDLDGDELILKLRSIDKKKQIQVYIGLTGFSQGRERFLNAGAAEVLTKPVEVTEMIDAMRRWASLLKKGKGGS